MSLVLGTDKQSKCMYCNTGTYGKGCPYSPHRVHVHVDDPKRCIYCGISTFGPGCLYNPFGKTHVHGVEFNMLTKENIHRNFSTALFITRLNEPIIETPAFKLGLVDETGRRVKIPETLDEKTALTPLDVYVFKLRRFLSEGKLEMLNASIVVEMMANLSYDKEFVSEEYEKEVMIKSKIANLVNDYKYIMSEAISLGFNVIDVEQMFTECIINEQLS